MLKQTKRALVLMLAAVFLLLGVAGLFLPFLQGVLFLAVGVLLLSVVFPPVREWLDRRTSPYPKIHAAVSKVDGWIKHILGEI